MPEVFDSRETVLDRMGFDDIEGEPVLRPTAAAELLAILKPQG